MELDGRAELFLSRIKRMTDPFSEEIPAAEAEAIAKMSFSEKIALRVTQNTIP
jgi:hypothetical protein